MVFIQAIHDLVVSQSLSVSHVFKTDDDSFVNTRELYRQLLVNNTSSNNHYFTQSNDYWGKCTPDKLKPYVIPNTNGVSVTNYTQNNFTLSTAKVPDLPSLESS